MPDKEGSDDEKKSTKSVINKKQKQMMGEEGYDIARDMGKVRPSKDKKDATTLRKPPSEEMKKTQKVNKGPSAFERVKAKYGKSVMNVGKKKVKEELDLTQVAEAFGGYIIESSPIIKKTGKRLGQTKILPGKGEEKAERELVTKKIEKQLKGQEKISTRKPRTSTPSLTRGSGFGPSERINPDDEKTQQTQQKVADQRIKSGKKQSTTAFTNEPIDDVNIPSEVRDPKTGETLTKDTPPTKQEIERKTKEVKDQSRKTRGSKEKVTRETEFISDPRKESEAPQITQSKGDGRKAGRRGKTVTYSIFTKKPEVTGGEDRSTDTRSSVDFPKPEKETKPETKRQKNTRTRKRAEKIIQDVRSGKLKTKSFVGDTEPQKDKVTTGDNRKTDTAFLPEPVKPEPSTASKVATSLKKSPVTPLIAYDLGKGILSKIMNLRGPAIRGGRAGFRSAGGNVAT